MKVNVIGAGFVGQTVAHGLAKAHEVWLTENNPNRLDALARGQYLERGIDLKLVRIREEAVRADAHFVCVGTPTGPEPVFEVVRTLPDPSLVVVKSTVLPGTCDALVTDARVVANPEFLAQGTAVRDFLRPDRVVLGNDDGRVERAYRAVLPADTPYLHVTARSAELGKYASNFALAARISLLNELATLDTGADIVEVSRIVAADHRLGTPVAPGIGYGGSCFPKDLKALGELGSLIADVVLYVNKKLIWEYAELCEGTVAIWGMTYKPGTSDVRQSRGLALAEELRTRGHEVTCHDPLVRPGELPLAKTVVLATEHEEYLNYPWERTRGVQRVVDARNALDRKKIEAAGIEYVGVGR